MEQLREAIERQGVGIGTDIVKVDMFLNHRIDTGLLFAMGEAWADAFRADKPDLVLTVEASGIAMAVAAVRQFVYNHVIDSAICYINRCNGQDLMYFRNNLKGINRNMMVVFLDMDSKMIKIERQMFDTTKPLNIEDNDYGLWYIDAVDDPEKYNGCEVTLKVKHLETLREYENVCIMGREAMVCCSNDLQQIGLTCTDVDPRIVEDGKWYYLKGKLKTIDDEQGGRTVILNTASVIEASAPEDEYVNFN